MFYSRYFEAKRLRRLPGWIKKYRCGCFAVLMLGSSEEDEDQDVAQVY